MSENTVLEGLALRRAVAEARGWRMDWHTDEDNVVGGLYFDQTGWYLCSPDNKYRRVYQDTYYMSLDDAWALALNSGFFLDIPAYDTDLNTIKDAAAMLTGGNQLVVYSPNPYGAKIEWQARVVGSDRFEAYHTEPATAAWNAVLRWLAARKQEVGNE